MALLTRGIDFHPDCPDPTTFVAYRLYPIVDPTNFWEGAGDAHWPIHGHGNHDGKMPLVVISQPKIHENALAAVAPPGPHWGAYIAPETRYLNLAGGVRKGY